MPSSAAGSRRRRSGPPDADAGACGRRHPRRRSWQFESLETAFQGFNFSRIRFPRTRIARTRFSKDSICKDPSFRARPSRATGPRRVPRPRPRAGGPWRGSRRRLSEVTYYTNVALPLIAANDGVAAGEAAECALFRCKAQLGDVNSAIKTRKVENSAASTKQRRARSTDRGLLRSPATLRARANRWTHSLPLNTIGPVERNDQRLPGALDQS